MVYVGRELVARWNIETKTMQFRGEGLTIGEDYERLLVEGRVVEDFTE